ncbi:hypothetical protein [Salegentibacter chungangensis]|uniref:Uncharacterized protein n=1 Tax=Salegentibacter chungangensis TaxID=1335724 RepID=A0ABW3NS05_9FLAO
MKTHFDLSDREFELLFKNGRLDPAIFNHEAHLRLAWIHINKYGCKTAADNINRQLLIYVTRLGARDKYNKTLTTASVKAVNHFMKKSEADNFRGFISDFPRLTTDFRELLRSHYKTDIFNSEKAKKIYLEPELLPFE